MDTKYYLPHSVGCFVCGEGNDKGMHCKLFTDGVGAVHIQTTVRPSFISFDKIVHGGLQTTLLDEAMSWCGFVCTDLESLCFTRELTAKYRKTVRDGVTLFVETKLVDVKRNFYYTEGVIRDDAGAICTQATAVFVPVGEDVMKSAAANMRFCNDGRQYFQKALDVFKPKEGNGTL